MRGVMLIRHRDHRDEPPTVAFNCNEGRNSPTLLAGSCGVKRTPVASRGYDGESRSVRI